MRKYKTINELLWGCKMGKAQIILTPFFLARFVSNQIAIPAL